MKICFWVSGSTPTCSNNTTDVRFRQLLIGLVAASPPITEPSQILGDIPALEFLATYTAQLHRNAPETLLDRLHWATEQTKLRALMYDYAVVQFNRRYTPLFDIITLELPHRDIFYRNRVTRQRLASQLARDSEQAYLQLLQSGQHEATHLQHALQLYRSHLAMFANKPVAWITEAAHKLH